MTNLRTRWLLGALERAPLLLFGLVFLGFGLLAPGFFEPQTLENIVKQASFVGIVAVGMTLVLLTAGIDLSVGANMYLSAATAGLLIQGGTPVPLAVLAGLAVGAVFGLANALAITRLGVIPFVTTLATLVAGRGLGLMLTESRAVPLPDTLASLGAARLFGLVPVPIVLFALVVLGAHLLLTWTPLGRQVYAVGHDAEAAAKAGLDVRRVLTAVYVGCGLLASVGGLLAALQLGVVNAGFGEGDEFDAIAAAVLGGASLFGGRGWVFPGTVIGALLIQTIAVGLVAAQVDLYVQPLVVALILLLAVFFDSQRTRYLHALRRRRIRAKA